MAGSLATPSRGRLALEGLAEGQRLDLDTLQGFDESWGDDAGGSLARSITAEMDHSRRRGTTDLAADGKLIRINFAAFPAEIKAALGWIVRYVELPAVSESGGPYVRCPFRSEVWRGVLRAGLCALDGRYALPSLPHKDLLKKRLFALSVTGFRFSFSRRAALDGATVRFQPSITTALLSEISDFAEERSLEFATTATAAFVAGLASDAGGVFGGRWGDPVPWPLVDNCRAAMEDFGVAVRGHAQEVFQVLETTEHVSM